mmetsp:Transcript_45607/g.83512  ORF Transcript_45607/g.83512 Transcript_45607/m.83512 type:complete len:299 (-) Transcript_45607:20-916(-)
MDHMGACPEEGSADDDIGFRKALHAVRQDWRSITKVPKELQIVDNYNIPVEAVTQCGAALGYVCSELRANRSVVMAAIRCNGFALRHAAEDLRCDYDIVMAAVSNCGQALQYASDELRANAQIVRAAVTMCGHALQFAAHPLTEDPEIVLAAVSNCGHALHFASKRLRSNTEIVMVAIANNGYALQYVAKELQQDQNTLQALVTMMPPGFLLVKLHMLSGRSCLLVHKPKVSSLRLPNLKRALLRACATCCGFSREALIGADLVLLQHASLQFGHINEVQLVLRCKSLNPEPNDQMAN